MEQNELYFETSKSTQKIDAVIFVIQNEAPIITKNGDNPYYNSKYAEYHEIQKAIRPLLFREKILISFAPVTGNRLVLNVKHIDSAEFIKITADLNSVTASPQAQGSAITYLKRYMITAIFDLIIDDASDDDGNKSSVNGQDTKQPATTSKLPPPSTEQAAAPVDRTTLPFLNPDTDKWISAKIWYFEKGKPLAKVVAKYRITAKNQTLLGEREVLKPGGKLWKAATNYLTKENAKIGSLTEVFDITDQDATDLQTDAFNIIQAASNK